MTNLAIATKTSTAKGKTKLPFSIDIAAGSPVDTVPDNDPIDALQKRMDLAHACHLATKKSALEAVAHACVYSRMIADDSYLLQWEEKRIEENNAEIKQHNAQIIADKKRSFDFVAGRLDKEDRIYTAVTEQEKTEASEEMARLKAMAARSEEDWKALRKVEIKARKDAGHTATVKFVFGLVRAADAPTVSRYQNVMQWVEEKFSSKFPESHEPIIQAIVEAHGFDAVLEAQRAKKPGKSANDKADKKAQAEHAKAETIRERVQTEEAKATVDVELNSADGLVVVLGRYSKGSLEVVRSFNVGPDELDKLLTRYAADAATKD